MKTSSCKAKGRRLQKAVVTKILEKFPFLDSRDVQSTSMGANGLDVKLSKAAFDVIPLAIECKNREANKNLIEAWMQANINKQGVPTVILGANGCPTLAVISLDALLTVYNVLYNTARNK